MCYQGWGYDEAGIVEIVDCVKLAVGGGILSLLGVEMLVDCERVNVGFVFLVVAPVLLPYHGLRIVLDFAPIPALMALTLALVLLVLIFALALVLVPLSIVLSHVKLQYFQCLSLLMFPALVLSRNLWISLNLFLAVVETALVAAAVPDRQSQPPLLHCGIPRYLELNFLSQFHR